MSAVGDQSLQCWITHYKLAALINNPVEGTVDMSSSINDGTLIVFGTLAESGQIRTQGRTPGTSNIENIIRAVLHTKSSFSN